MPTLQADYAAAYRSLKLTRDASGVRIAEFHTNGGPLRFTLTRNTGKTASYIDEFGCVPPLVPIVFAVYFWRRAP